VATSTALSDREAKLRDGAQSSASVSGAGGSLEEPPRASSALAEAGSILGDLKGSPFRRNLTLLAGGLVVILVANAIGQIGLNFWQGNFFSAVGQKDASQIRWQLLVFLGLVPILLGLVVAQTWLHQLFKVALRHWLTSRLLDYWLAPGRAYRLNISWPEDLNTDQRIQEDVRNFSEMTADLGVGLVSAALLLLGFIGVL
jgi:vitamin B12/bleomycin/antimicrobial peptide transport system ATP-binding/permease protein